MRFHIVMAKTIGELMSLKRTGAIIGGGLLIGVGLYFLVWQNIFETRDMLLEMQTSYLVGYFIIISFIWLAGFYLAYLVVGTPGLEFVAKEEEKGTLLLMVSKPLSRLQFLLGKFLALVLTTMLLEIIMLLGTVLLLGKLLGLDPDAMGALLGLVPWIFLFSVIVTLLFASVSIALSTVIKSDTVRGLVFMLIIMLVFGAGPVLRMMWPDTYENYHLYYLDGGYNLGNTYVSLLDQAESGRMMPQSQAWLGITTGAYRAGTEVVLTMFLGASEALDPDIGAMPPSLEKTAYINPAVSAILCLAVSGAAFGVANVFLNRKEVH